MNDQYQMLLSSFIEDDNEHIIWPEIDEYISKELIEHRDEYMTQLTTDTLCLLKPVVISDFLSDTDSLNLITLFIPKSITSTIKDIIQTLKETLGPDCTMYNFQYTDIPYRNTPHVYFYHNIWKIMIHFIISPLLVIKAIEVSTKDKTTEVDIDYLDSLIDCISQNFSSIKESIEPFPELSQFCLPSLL